jgi:hypothetical protein
MIEKINPNPIMVLNKFCAILKKIKEARGSMIIARKNIILGVLIGLILLLTIGLHEKRNWHHSFFKALEDQKIEHYRLLSIWVRGDQPDHKPVNPIGGSEEKFIAWKKAMNAFLKAAQKKEKPFVRVALILDKETRAITQELISQWEQDYPGHLDIIFLENLVTVESDRTLLQGFKQCTEGIPSICSDFLRNKYLHDEKYEVNVYLDIDTFTQSYEHRYSLKSADVFGLGLGIKGLFNTFNYNKGSISWNGDLLIDYDSQTNWPYIHALLKEELDHYNHFYEDIIQRSYRLRLPSLTAYQENLVERMHWWIKNPDRNFNQNALIIQGIGPVFWEKMMLRNQSNPYSLSNTKHLDNYFSWNEDKKFTFFNYLCIESLSAQMNEGFAHSLLKITLMIYDYQYFNVRQLPWMNDLGHYIVDEWEQLKKQCPQVEDRFQVLNLFIAELAQH